MGYIQNMAFKSQKLISYQNGILRSISRACRMNEDPLCNSFGIVPCDTTILGGARYGGRSSGSGKEMYHAYMTTIGETIERYCPALFKQEQMLKASYKSLGASAINPKEFALFSKEQIASFKSNNDTIQNFDEETVVYWDNCVDITTGENKLCPSTFIYLPWNKDPRPIFYGVSTGLAAHSNYFKSVLTSLYEVIERDSFVLTWFQKIVYPKIFISEDISTYINSIFPVQYDWHLFDITYDLEVPTIFGICMGHADFGDFIAVGTATRSTKGEALKKVIQEIAQAIPYFRYILSIDKSVPSDNFADLKDFAQHSVFYLKNPKYKGVFSPWIEAQPSIYVDINEISSLSVKDKILDVSSKLKAKKYNVLVKDLTTIDALQCGMYCTRVIVPQLLQMTGAYSYYPLGGKRLYEVPVKCGYISHDFRNLNKFPHPFP